MGRQTSAINVLAIAAVAESKLLITAANMAAKDNPSKPVGKKSITNLGYTSSEFANDDACCGPMMSGCANR